VGNEQPEPLLATINIKEDLVVRRGAELVVIFQTPLRPVALIQLALLIVQALQVKLVTPGKLDLLDLLDVLETQVNARLD
jgi:hypothetical protein